MFKQKRVQQAVQNGFFYVAVLIGAMLVAVWARYKMPFGEPLVFDQYNEFPLATLLIFVCAVSLAIFLVDFAARRDILQPHIAPHRYFRVFLVALFVTIMAVLLLQPDVSQLQVGYFAFGGVVLGAAVLVLPNRFKMLGYEPPLMTDRLQRLWQYRYLMRVWLRYRIDARYRQTILGLMWIMLLPLATAAVLAFAFTQLLGAGGLDVPFVVFLLSGQVFYAIFSSVVARSPTMIIGAAGLIKQVAFPREVLLLLQLGEALIDFAFSFVALLAVSALFQIYPNVNYVLILVPVMILALMAIGIGFIFSWLGLLVRDMQQLTGVILQLLFFMTVLYSPQRANPSVQSFVSLSPLSDLVTAFRDVVLYQQMPDWITLYYPFVFAMVMFYLGYTLFKSSEDRFVDLV